MENWTEWKPMPSPENCRNIEGPKGAGVYQIRNADTNDFIQFGIGKECQKRMKSFFPKPYGIGKRNNEHKRQYIYDNWQNLEYRTCETTTREEAVQIENTIKAQKNHLFNT
jgi:hypothetical protein